MGDLLTSKEAAGLLRCCPMTPYRRVHRGEIPAVMLPGGWLFDRQDIERFVKSRTVLPSRTAG